MFAGAENEVCPPQDENFSGYVEKRERSSIQRSFSCDLLAAALGVSCILILVLVEIL